MIFSQIFEQTTSNHCTNTIYREAVRAIIINNQKILLVHSEKGDYKFPGGGLEDNETHSQGLVREVKEETGYVNCRVQTKVGFISEKTVDVDDDNQLFQMMSHYYLCELIDEQKIDQQLEAYELAQQFTAKWVSLDDAIKQNESLLNESQNNRWLPRETFVLKALKKYYGQHLK
ncbi:NUDIX hydrolase [Lysinibacillus sp. NPDC097195]|uniref:NUDIX hydrolase n=1 Tax=Lysinibacillus sp. NPDC097195 TaxID=3364141 RepID=UPI0038185C75